MDRSSANVRVIVFAKKNVCQSILVVLYIWFGAVIGMSRMEKCNTYLQCLIPELARKQKLLLDLI